MGKLTQDFTIWKGNNKRLDFFIEDISSVSGGTAQWGLSTGADSAIILLLKTTEVGSGITMSGKTVFVNLTASDTNLASGILSGTYYHELRLVDNIGQPFTPAIGTITLNDVILPLGE
jgi:hypothetical protein